MLKHLKRRADLSDSSRRKLKMFEEIIAKILEETSPNQRKMSPALCMKILKYACEVRNKALQGTMVRSAKYRIGESYYKRDALAKIRWFMLAIKRPMVGALTKEYKGYQLYYGQQKTYFGQF